MNLKWIARTAAFLMISVLLMGAGVPRPRLGATAGKRMVKIPAGRIQAAAYEVPASKEEQLTETWYTEEEAEMMAWIIQQEVRGGSLRHKRIIAEVILNRVRSPRFPNTISEVLLTPGQFTSAANWRDRTYEPDTDTRQAVREALSGQLEPASGGAVFFYAPRWTDPKIAAWFESLPLKLELEGHRFFCLK